MLDLKELGDELTLNIKQASFFPFKTGNLKFNATSGTLINTDTYLIKFDGTIAPYLEYLEEGTKPHIILPVKAKALKFKIGDKIIFATKVNHPGSTKHKDFIKDKTIHLIIDYICQKYKGELR